MHFNLIDIAILAYVAFGAIWARRRGLGVEVQAGVGWLVALFTGCGIYRWTTRGLEHVSQATGLTFGIFSFIAIFVAAYLIVRRLKWRIRAYTEKKFAESPHTRVVTMTMGGLRALLLSSVVMLFIMMLPIGFLRKPFQGGSFVGRVLNRIVLPVQRFTHGDEPPPPPAVRTNTPPPRPFRHPDSF